jgi:long-chain acyl-CoA synthetase
MIVLPNGFNVYPEDIENALRIAGIRDSVVLETRPGRIEALLLDPRRDLLGGAEARHLSEDDVKKSLDEAVRTANRSLGANQHIAAWRLWPEPDFPRTHTLKVRRNEVRAWAATDGAPSVREAATSGLS